MGLKVYGHRMSQPARAVYIFCNHAILRYLACAFPGVPDHWLVQAVALAPKLGRQPKPQVAAEAEILFHAILRYLACAFPGVPDHWLVQAVAVLPKLGRQPKPQVAAEAEILLCESLEKIETVWLKESGPFLLGNSEPSIADLSLVCEIMQLEVLDEKDIDRILGPRKIVQQWMEDTKNATKPHFEEIHGLLYETKAELQKQRLGANNA
ncbi:hypothetical protein RHGRI_005820 [Rhododendron griersonianum]|uniref:Glutathione S-transferase n=1 Tax=Rhododendron griersonianum TaxID=479676 RepID=A0AAV6LFP4_9ERIC|nr:hypothetical protein RHGRI_005820 [Rhododendron griersonianum]